MKCIKCDLRFKDRKDPADEGSVDRELCWNCRFVWQCVRMVMTAIPPRINRKVTIKLDDVLMERNKNTGAD